jgi:iron complex transport system substrate-binding protein
MRVVSLLPAATEIVAALGATEHLVGVTHECDYPPLVASRARVTRSAIAHGGDPGAIDAEVRSLAGAGRPLFTLDEARIRALHPDVLLTQALCDVCAVSETDVRALATTLSPAPRVVTLGGTSLDGVFADIVAVAEAIGAADEAEELLAGLRERVQRVHGRLREAQAPRPRVALLEWTDPVYVAGHWGPEQVKRAGGIDVLGTAGAHSEVVSMDELVAADPEIVIVAPCGYGLEAAVAEARRVAGDGAWGWLRGRAVWAMDANGLVSRPGPRIVDGIEAMARMFNPGVLSGLDPRHAVRIE